MLERARVVEAVADHHHGLARLLEFADEAELLAGSADPERTYVDVILPRKLLRQAEYAQRANWATDLAVIARTLGTLAKR